MHEVKVGQKYRRTGDWGFAKDSNVVEVESVEATECGFNVAILGGPSREHGSYFFQSQHDFNKSNRYVGYVLVEESEEAPETDAVNHPSHYNSDPSGVECIEITRHRNFNIGAAFKYLWRAGLKEDASLDNLEKEIEDLEKAIFHIKDEIKRKRGE